MTVDKNNIGKQIDALRAEKGKLERLVESYSPLNQIEIQRVKKRKLELESRIRQLEDSLLPDIIA